MSNYLISSLIDQQVPDFIESDYPTFVSFLQKYYEWMQSVGNPIYESEQIQYNHDVDLASDLYVEQIKKEFLPYFPEVISLDKRTFLKFVSKFYSTKGTPNSVKFLFRALFNENVEIFYPKDDVLIASDGKWVLPLALRVDTTDENIFNIENTLITGETSKATALVESVTRSIDRQLGISYIELYISNVQRLFQTGEFVTSTYNDGVTDVTVRAKLIGSLSEIRVDPRNRGAFYRGFDPILRYDGDPLTIVGGLNTESDNPIGALAFVGSVTEGGVTEVLVTNGGFGFRDPLDTSLGNLLDFKGGFRDTLFGTEASATVSLVDQQTVRTMNVSTTTIELILNRTLDNVGNTGNAQTSQISSAYSSQSFNVHPISFVTLTGSGGGYTSRPELELYSFYNEDFEDVLVVPICNIIKGSSSITVFGQDLRISFEVGDLVRLFLRNRFEEIKTVVGVTQTTVFFSETFENDISGVSIFKILRNDIYKLGSLGRIQIEEGGSDYSVGEHLIFSGGSGYGANAQISSLHSSNNGIKSVEFIQTNDYVIGGEGYRRDSLPEISVNTISGSNAVLRVTEVAGDGESFALSTSRIGAISTIRIVSFGYDYVSAPTVSLRNADLIVSNVTPGLLFVSNTKVYQGTSNVLPTFSAFVDKFDVETGFLRIYDYRGNLNIESQIISDDGEISANIENVFFYGDGRGRATARFENGLIRYPGLYLNTDGHLSEDKRLQDGEKYHNFSYVINTTKDYDTFETPLNNIIHPVGMKTFVNRLYNNETPFENNIENILYKEISLEQNFSFGVGTNSMTSNSNTANLMSIVSVGDEILLKNQYLRLQGTVQTSQNSNSVIGISTNFINEIQDGDIIYISTGNTEIVTSVESNTSLITQNTISFNSTNSTINLIVTEVKSITFVNANTIFVDTNFVMSGNNVSVLIRKVE
jgi:hypothetical protein